MTYRFTETRIGAQPIADTDAGTSVLVGTTTTIQLRHPLGTIVRAVDPTYGEGEFIYLKGVASTVVGDWVGYSPAVGTSVRAVANGNYPLAVAMSACNTTTLYGWYQISGTALANGLTSITTAGSLYLTSTAGSVDDASVIGDAVHNARKNATVHVIGTFLDKYNVARPFCENRVSLSN